MHNKRNRIKLAYEKPSAISGHAIRITFFDQEPFWLSLEWVNDIRWHRPFIYNVDDL